MNYVTDGIFWVVVLAIAGSLWGIWYNLKKQNEETAKSLKELQSILGDSFHKLAKAADEDGKRSSNSLAEIRADLSLIFEILGELTKKTDKVTKKKITEIMRKYE